MRIFIFIICLFCGVVSGVLYDVLYVARVSVCGLNRSAYTVKDKIFIIIADILYCLAFTAGFIFVSVMFGFEAFRLYMFLGCVLGAALYLKSFHEIIAFFVNKVYNRYRSLLKERKVGRAKKEQNGRRSDGKRITAHRHIGRRAHLSDG